MVTLRTRYVGAGRVLSGGLGLALAASYTLGFTSPLQTLANNRGDVWVDTVGTAPGPGHEMDPHLPCADINLLGNDLSPSGTFTISGWPPSGSQEMVYPATDDLNWSYSSNEGGTQNLLSHASNPGLYD